MLLALTGAVKKVLIVQTNSPSRETLVRRLSLHGYEVHAGSLDEAFRIAGDTQPELILIEPVAGRESIIKRLMTHASTFRIPIVTMNSPVNLIELVRKIEEHLQQAA